MINSNAYGNIELDLIAAGEEVSPPASFRHDGDHRPVQALQPRVRGDQEGRGAYLKRSMKDSRRRLAGVGAIEL